MAENKVEDLVLPSEKRKLVVNGKRYYSATNRSCPSCSGDNRFLFVKLILDGTTCLECPVCDTAVNLPTSQVPEATQW